MEKVDYDSCFHHRRAGSMGQVSAVGWSTGVKEPDPLNEADKELQRKNQDRFRLTEKLKEKRSERSNLKSQLQPFLAEKKKHNEIMDEKRKEMEPLQKGLAEHRTARNSAREGGMGLCSSEEELDDLIRSLHYRIQHESNTLNEEKQLLKEIKQLEATREKVIANVAVRMKIENSKGQTSELQDKMKLLGVNMDEVRKERKAVVAQIEQIDEKLKVVNDEIASLEEGLRSITEKRDNAYETLNTLRRKRDEVNSCFYQNRSLLNSARDLAAKKDKEQVEALCNSEVEKFMSQWSSNKAFRDDYERRILKSLDIRQLSRDGRMRNPDEKPIVVETPPAAKLETSALKVAPKHVNEVIKPPKSEEAQAQEVNKPAKAGAGRKENSTGETENAYEYEQTKELSKPKEVDPTKLKEMKREEEIAKAKLAMERKKKLAEKAATKAAARAQKEAEKKLKQKEKKAKKKAGANEPDAPAEETERETKAEEPEDAEKWM
ncbi:uncharacterized protein A4U43_C01F2630 [Asparagus officinalis]|uniref:Proton pump-interactor 1 n=1 Tax=Asparagus officinalis TaxID=4686 RepID=A0A5P1FLV6_ASPOF|nr:uncharacterized protein A4U43_C01F2630 [Asparagus officinalis]